MRNISISNIFLKFVKRNIKIIFSLIFFFSGLIIERIIFPHYYGKIIDTISKIKPLSIFVESKKYIIIVIVLTIISQILFTWNDYLDTNIIPKMQTFFRNSVINDIITTFRENYKEIEIGDVISKLLKLPNTIKDIYNQFKNYILSAIIIAIFTVIYFFFINKKLGLLTLIILVVYSILILNIGKRCILPSVKRDELHNSLYEQISDTLSNLNTVYSFNNTNKENKRIGKYTNILDMKYTDSLICSVNFKLMYSFLYILMFLSINGYSFYLTYKKEIKVGQLVSILFIITYLLGDLQTCSGEIKDFLYNIGVLKLNQNFLNQLINVNQNKNMKLIHDFKFNQGEIKFENVSFSYNNNNYILKNFNLNIKGKSTTIIMGNIGSGKSTISKLLLKFYNPNSGKIWIDNQDISKLSSDMVRQKIAYIPQNTKLFNRSIHDNVTYGLYKDKKEILLLIKKYELDKIFDNLNTLLDKDAGKNGENLSGGQRQIICFLRVLINIDRYSIVIFDEPTSALDNHTKNLVIKIIKVISEKKTCIIICHDKELLYLADRYIFLKNGIITLDQNMKI